MVLSELHPNCGHIFTCVTGGGRLPGDVQGFGRISFLGASSAGSAGIGFRVTRPNDITVDGQRYVGAPQYGTASQRIMELHWQALIRALQTALESSICFARICCPEKTLAQQVCRRCVWRENASAACKHKLQLCQDEAVMAAQHVCFALATQLKQQRSWRDRSCLLQS